LKAESMSDVDAQKLSSLLQQGLELYGTGDVAQAFLLWGEVLELDPGNEEALDYMRDADRRAKPRGGNAEIGNPTLVENARRLMRSGDAEAALELLSSAPGEHGLEHEGMIELLRAALFTGYRAELGDLGQIPQVVPGQVGELESRNLPPSVGFLLSMIDGVTPLGDLISVSGMDRFEALRAVSRLRQAGIVEWGAS
jgi:hypothetical protein